jgi:hypothetical protein
MTSPEGIHRIDPQLVVDGLRRWAAGSPSDLAAVEVLSFCFAGRYLRAGWPWVRSCRRPGWFWLHPAPLLAFAQRQTGGRRAVLLLAAALLIGDAQPSGRVDQWRWVA